MTGPLYGGVGNTSLTLGDEGGNADGDGDGDDGSNFVWFDPIAYYCSQPSVSVSDCAFFCNACAAALLPTLINLNELQGSAPQYPAFNQANIEALGVCAIFMQWVYSSWWSAQTGQAEGSSGAPGAPPSGPGNGPGIPG